MSETPKQAPKKKKREDFHLGKILGEGSYSTVSFKMQFVCMYKGFTSCLSQMIALSEADLEVSSRSAKDKSLLVFMRR